MNCTNVSCVHAKIPYGGHCAWKWCLNYRGKCDVHRTYPPRDK